MHQEYREQVLLIIMFINLFSMVCNVEQLQIRCKRDLFFLDGNNINSDYVILNHKNVLVVILWWRNLN